MTKNINDVKKLPVSPGVYIMKDRENKVIYVGKANSLRGRVSHYFREQESPKNCLLMKNFWDLEYITTGNEIEALVLESNLIKEHRPRYNVKLRDDKNYPFIKITNEKFPRICVSRRRERDGAQYFGPYPGSRAVREVIKMASGLGIRRCKKKLPCPPCLNYHIKQCAAPCLGNITKEEYLEIINNVTTFLKGKQNQLILSLNMEMERLSQIQDYEKAARVRDQINALLELSEKQRVNLPGRKEQDIIAYAVIGSSGSAQVFHVSGGILKGRETFSLDTAGSEEKEILPSIIKQYYQDVEPPEEIITQDEIIDETISLWLSGKGSKVKTPKNKVEKGLMDLAAENAGMLLKQEILSHSQGANEALSGLKDALLLPIIPSLIEAFDISNISGTNATGSLVSFENGVPDKKNYRRFRIKTIEGADDYAMIGEVVGRAYSRRKEEGKRMPDLVLIDGGKGQLNSALDAISRIGLKLNIASLAKEFEYIFTPYKESPVILPRDSPGLKLLQSIRDEAHRFALSYHRKLRGKKLSESLLDRIPGIGIRKKQALLKYFGSVGELRRADISEIGKVPGLKGKDAENILKFLQSGDL
ncbi:MAG: excinuclease ABC subunit UvrC [Candidatus Methanoperedens sp.]|nr:excinuclease ABC subunit UvrC [Candidatus Methanoperedens sp.]